MAEISVALIKELRERTGAGMMDCKKALVELDGDIEKAIEYLREKGLSAAAKKAGRVAAEGLVSAFVDQNVGVLVEVNCETDFVAKNAQFKQLVHDVVRLVAANNPKNDDELLSMPMANGLTVGETVQGLVTTFGENMTIRRFNRFEVQGTGALESYIHEDFLTEGKLGVLIEASAGKQETLSAPEFRSFLKGLTMHIAAIKPAYVRREEIPAEVLEQEKSIYRTQAMNEGKPEAIAEKIMQGRIEKFYKDVCLMEQNYVKDQDKTVAQLITELNGKFGETISIVRFASFEKGEGIEKKADDFVSEVMSMSQTDK